MACHLLLSPFVEKRKNNYSLHLLRKMINPGTSLVVRWLRLYTLNAGDKGSIPGGGILHRAWSYQKEKKKIIIPSGGLYFLTSSEPNYLPKFPLSNTSCWGLVLTCILGVHMVVRVNRNFSVNTVFSVGKLGHVDKQWESENNLLSEWKSFETFI